MVITMKRIFSMLLLCIALQGTGNAIDTWTSPQTLSTSGVNATNSCVAVDPLGNSVAVWLEGTVLKADTLPIGGSWGTPTTRVASGASQPHVVVDGSGIATAIWAQSGTIKTATKPFGSAWGLVITLSTGSSTSSPAIAANSNGDLVAVWLDSGLVKTKTHPFGSSWSSVTTLSTAGMTSSAPKVAIGDDSVNNYTVVAVWQTLNSGTSIYNINGAKHSHRYCMVWYGLHLRSDH